MPDPSERCDLDDVYDILKTIGLQRFYNTFVADGIYDGFRYLKTPRVQSETQYSSW